MTTPPNYPGRIWTDTSNDFAHDTMKRRVPDIIKSIQERNPDYPASVQNALTDLSREIQYNEPIQMLHPTAPDHVNWLPAVDTRRDHKWLDTDWFFAETYFYRRVIECVRWWETGRDPFTPNKREEYATDSLWELLKLALEANGTVEEHLLEGLSRALWGNRIDLSFAASMAHGTVVNTDDLIVDDSAFAVTQILRGQGLIHLIADNAGTELTMDLALIDTLLETTTATVMLHVKMHPTFVSDAIPADVWNFFATLEERGGLFADFGERLQKAFEQKRFFILPHMFWNSPYSMWQMPSQLKELLDQGRILIVKGDANYRRLLGDAVWPTHTAFADVVSYFKAPVLALRTLKSDPIIGLPHGLPTRLEEINPEWRINGKHGVIQFKA